MTALTSPSNPKIKQIRALKQRKTRQDTGLFVVEGIRHVGEAFEAGADFSYLCYCPDLLKSDYALALVRQLEKQGTSVYAVAGATFAGLAEKENPQGLLAVVRQAQRPLADLQPANFAWGVALVAPQDPGNLGTVLRTVDAVGASGLLLLDSTTDVYHPSAVRASMGTVFWYPVASATFAEFAAWAGKHGYTVYGTSAHGNVSYEQVTRYRQPMILLMGSEREGLTESQTAACNQLVRLPMLGHATSLNIAVATGVMLYQMLEKQIGK
ncbi:MAG: TrmH family RNA methyltransferase [Chloroflexota bacterium]